MRLRLTLMGLALVSCPAFAADPELTELRQQVQQLKRDYEQKIRALEARVSRAEAAAERAQTPRRNAIGAQPAPLAQSPLDKALAETSAMASEQEPSTTTRTTPAPFSGASIGPFSLIDVSFNILGVGGWSTAPDRIIEELEGGAHDPKRRGFTLQQGELGLAGAVDPYFNAQAYIVFTDESVELEEAYLTTTSLPWDLQVKAGYFFTEFGRNNPLHPHSWAWIDQPFINTRLLGGEGNRAAGTRLSWLLPTLWYSEIYLGVQNANNETEVSFLGEREGAEGGIGGLTATKDDVDNLTDLLYLARWANSWDLNPEWSTQIGLSALHGPNLTGNRGETWIYGTDLVAKWRPSNSYRGWPFLIWETEIMARDYDIDTANPAFDPASMDKSLKDWGFYTQALHGFTPRWAAGLRFEYAGGSGNGLVAREDDPFRADRFRFSPLLAFYPSEFSRIRLQYNYDHADNLTEDEHSVWVGFEVSYGAHSAHKY